MTQDAVDLARLADAVEAVRREVSRLRERVAALETAVPASSPVANELSEELILVISAAIAAYLGKKPHIRQIRLLGTAGWAQQGRLTIQASHLLPHS
jgi:methylmalonyl-CoA carboxyltransferase large subunit